MNKKRRLSFPPFNSTSTMFSDVGCVVLHRILEGSVPAIADLIGFGLLIFCLFSDRGFFGPSARDSQSTS